MTTTEIVMVPTAVEVNPIFDELVASMGLDPFDDMQLVEIEVDGQMLTLDAMDRTEPPAWQWPDDDILNEENGLDLATMVQVLAGRAARSWDTTGTGLMRIISDQLLFNPPALPPGLSPAVDPWETKAVEVHRPQTLTDTMTTPMPVQPGEPTLLGLGED